MSDSNTNAPIDPVEMLVAHASQWLDSLEQKLEEAKKKKKKKKPQQQAYDDIPTFVTRYR